jgi:hypothetical protein
MKKYLAMPQSKWNNTLSITTQESAVALRSARYKILQKKQRVIYGRKSLPT